MFLTLFSTKNKLTGQKSTEETKLKEAPEQFEPDHWWGGPHGGSGQAGPSPEQHVQGWRHHLDNEYKGDREGLKLLSDYIYI